VRQQQGDVLRKGADDEEEVPRLVPLSAEGGREGLQADRLGGNIWAGGDASCLATAQSNFDLCNFVCTEAEQDCRTAFKFCVANCPNL